MSLQSKMWPLDFIFLSSSKLSFAKHLVLHFHVRVELYQESLIDGFNISKHYTLSLSFRVWGFSGFQWGNNEILDP